MILGVGTDILYMEALSATALEPGDPFLLKTYTKEEIRQAGLRPVPSDYYRDRFAGKEAVFKALGLSPEGISLGDIEILDDENGTPFVRLYGKILEKAKEKNLGRIHISLSYMEKYAVAFAVAETKEDPA